MKLNKVKLTLILVVLTLLVGSVYFFNFNYISIQEPVIRDESVDSELIASFTYIPTRKNIAGIMVYVDRSFLIKNQIDKQVFLTVSLENSQGTKTEIDHESYPVDYFNYKGFKKIILKEPIKNNDLEKIIFDFKLSSPLAGNESFDILKENTRISTKYEVPRIIYHDSLRGLSREFLNRFGDTAFGGPYLVFMGVVLFLILSLFTFDVVKGTGEIIKKKK